MNPPETWTVSPAHAAQALRRYHWRGIDAQGRKVSGEWSAHSHAQVVTHLRGQRIRATRVQRQLGWGARPPAIRARHLALLTRQLATLLQAGVPLVQSLHIAARGLSHAGLQALLLRIQHDIEQGTALHTSLRKQGVFDDLYCQLVAAGEQAGALDDMLLRLAQHLEKTEQLRGRLRAALTYPLAVLAIAAVVIGVVLVYVVPVFQTIFASMGAELPWATQALLSLSAGFIQWAAPAVVLCMVLAWLAHWQYQRSPAVQLQVHSLVLRLPLWGHLVRTTCLARWSRTLATLCRTGVPLVEALETVGAATGNRVYALATQHIRQALLAGTSLAQALELNDATPALASALPAQGLFSSMLVQMVALGEESGSLDVLLGKAADDCDNQLSTALEQLASLMEPALIAVLGVVIGGLVVALYLPIFQMGQVI